IRTTASVSLTSVPSFSKWTRFRIRSKTAASSELELALELALFVFWLEGAGTWATASALIIQRIAQAIEQTRVPTSERPTTMRDIREDILEFFYALPGVISN